MSQHDLQLPEDLRDIAERLSVARVTPSRLELDELCRRVYRRVERGRTAPRRRRFATVLGMNVVAAALTLGLMLTSGVGVVLASQWFGGGQNTYENTNFNNKDKKDSSDCEYDGEESHDYSWKTHDSTVYVHVVKDCKDETVYFTCNKPFGYEFGNGPTYDTKLKSYTTTAPGGATSLTLYEGGSKYKFSFG